MSILNAIIHWVEHDQEERLKSAVDLLGNVRWDLMTVAELELSEKKPLLCEKTVEVRISFVVFLVLRSRSLPCYVCSMCVCVVLPRLSAVIRRVISGIACFASTSGLVLFTSPLSLSLCHTMPCQACNILSASSLPSPEVSPYLHTPC